MAGETLYSRLRITGRAHTPVIYQTEMSECGLACLAMVASHHGLKVDLTLLRRTLGTSSRGTTLKGLIGQAEALNLSCRPLRIETETLGELKCPAILHWNLNHFVVLTRVSSKGIEIHDPAAGRRRVPWAQAGEAFSGVALELTPGGSFAGADHRRPLDLRILWSRLSGHGALLAQVIFLSLLMQGLLIAGPFYLKLAVDEALPANDVGLMWILAFGFGALVVFGAAVKAVRGLLLLYVGSMISFQIAFNLVRHMLRLPLPFYERRTLGALLIKFRSIEPIRKLLTEDFAAAIIDGIFLITVFILMVIYAPGMTLITMISIALFLAARYGLFSMHRSEEINALEAQARQNNSFVEMARGIMSIKLAVREGDRERLWSNYYVDEVNSNMRARKYNIVYDTLKSLLMGLELIALVLLGILLITANHMTLGMLIAFLALRQQFSEKAYSLVDKLLEFRMVNLHVERLADVIDETPEYSPDDTGDLERSGVPSRIEVSNVTFRFGPDEPEILSEASLTLHRGSSIAVIGPSGCGKTTFVKILLGLLEPESGEIRIDGQPLKHYGIRRYRRLCGTVMQNEELFSGSIADNISFFDTHPDMSAIEEAAVQAQIHDTIMAMPMRYNTLVGDSGSTLSGGQKQRLLLARALYRKPHILVMDEGTSHLDVITEEAINRTIAAMGITRVIIAHRPDTIRSAGTVYYLRDGCFEKIDPGALDAILSGRQRPEEDSSWAGRPASHAKLAMRAP